MEILYMTDSKDKKPQNEDKDLKLTPKEEELLKKKLEELRKRDPFVYR
tara:strand:- start:254 stop:397 length:144 start_codon:yes stop_codon:yes gene_type:complete